MVHLIPCAVFVAIGAPDDLLQISNLLKRLSGLQNSAHMFNFDSFLVDFR